MCYELGEGGAPEAEGKRLELLEKHYKEGALWFKSLGFNGEAFDFELP